jgi:DNA-binding NtrC family response regulator
MERTFRRGSIREMERLMIFDRLNQLGQNRTRSAESLDISVRTLRNKLREYREQAVVGAAVREEG